MLSRENTSLPPLFRSRRLSTSLVAILFATCLFSQQLSDKAEPPKPQGNPATAGTPGELAPLVKQFIDVFNTVQAESADRTDVDKLIYGGAIPSMLRPLDPHTQFFDPGQFDQLRQMESSEQKGFGSIVSVLPGRVIFLQTLPGTPSNKAGIQAGDELVAIGSVMIQKLDPDQIVQLLTQARQQKISVLIRREGSPRPLQFMLEPEMVDAPSVDRAFLLAPKIGFIRIAGWEPQTAKLFRDAVEKLGGNGLTGLVIDLRNNPGGVVTAALDMGAVFLKPGQKILTAKGRATAVQTADVPPNAKPYTFRAAILINAKTASASEIFAGAMQDHDRARIVGETSYGKGLVQTVLPLSSGAGMAITTAFYYTPSGRSIQHPLRDSALSGTFSSDVKAKDRPAFKTDSGRTVYGGGGIQPDIQVASEGLNRLEQVLTASGAITSYATQYLSQHSPLPENFDPGAAVLDDFKVFLSSRNIQPGVPEWSAERGWLVAHLKEEIVTQAQGVAKGDEVQAQTDPQVQAALRAITAP